MSLFYYAMCLKLNIFALCFVLLHLHVMLSVDVQIISKSCAIIFQGVKNIFQFFIFFLTEQGRGG